MRRTFGVPDAKLLRNTPAAYVGGTLVAHVSGCGRSGVPSPSLIMQIVRVSMMSTHYPTLIVLPVSLSASTIRTSQDSRAP